MMMNQTSLVKNVEAALKHKFNDPSLVVKALAYGSNSLKNLVSFNGTMTLYLVGMDVLRMRSKSQVILPPSEVTLPPVRRYQEVNGGTEGLARIAVNKGLYLFILNQPPHLDKQIQDFVKAMRKYPIHSNGVLNPPKVLADIVKSLLEAVCRDTRGDVRKVYEHLFKPLINPDQLEKMMQASEDVKKNMYTIKNRYNQV